MCIHTHYSPINRDSSLKALDCSCTLDEDVELSSLLLLHMCLPGFLLHRLTTDVASFLLLASFVFDMDKNVVFC